MIDIKQEFIDYCNEKNISFDNKRLSILSYNDSTLFCPAGIQQYNHLIKTNYKGTIANIQPCLRMNDIEEVGDGTHLLYFNMIGLFSFRQLSVKEAIDFWMGFLLGLNIEVNHVTIHPNNKEWTSYYEDYDVEVREDLECFWSDGISEGYCTEFYAYYNNEYIEIGNIVNPNKDCIDVGFGLERLNMIVNGEDYSQQRVLEETILELINSNIIPSNKKQGYILRKLIRLYYRITKNQDFTRLSTQSVYKEEIKIYKKAMDNYNRNSQKAKFKYKPKEWWFDTFGIDPDEL